MSAEESEPSLAISDAAGRKNHLPVGKAMLGVCTEDIAIISMALQAVRFCTVEQSAAVRHILKARTSMMFLSLLVVIARDRDFEIAPSRELADFFLHLPSLSPVSCPTTFFITIIAKRPGTIKQRYSQEYSRSSRHDARLRQAIGGDPRADQGTARGWLRPNHHP